MVVGQLRSGILHDAWTGPVLRRNGPFQKPAEHVYVRARLRSTDRHPVGRLWLQSRIRGPIRHRRGCW